MTINIGRIDVFLMHYGEDPLQPLCRLDQVTGLNSLNAATTDPAKVTCNSCIEWMHA